MSDNFNRLYKQASSKLFVLSALNGSITPEYTYNIYSTMILPALIYNCINNLSMNCGQKSKLLSIKKLAEKITKQPVSDLCKQIKKHSVILVRKCFED